MMADREKVIKAYEDFVNGYECFCTSDDYEYEMHKAVLALLKEQETANLYKCPNCGTWVSAENVVRCKDCKHGRQYDTNAVDCEYRELATEPDWFCADGEAKT